MLRSKVFDKLFMFFAFCTGTLVVLASIFGVFGALNQDGALGVACISSVGLAVLNGILAAICIALRVLFQEEEDL